MDLPSLRLSYPDDDPHADRGRKPCDYVGALLWPHERIRHGTSAIGVKWVGKVRICCRRGQVSLPVWRMPVPSILAWEVLKVWEEDTDRGKLLRDHARKVGHSIVLNHNN